MKTINLIRKFLHGLSSSFEVLSMCTLSCVLFYIKFFNFNTHIYIFLQIQRKCHIGSTVSHSEIAGPAPDITPTPPLAHLSQPQAGAMLDSLTVTQQPLAAPPDFTGAPPPPRDCATQPLVGAMLASLSITRQPLDMPLASPQRPPCIQPPGMMSFPVFNFYE